MAFRQLTRDEVIRLKPRAHYITTTEGLSGHFAVDVWINPDGGFSEPYQSGLGRYATQLEAEEEAVEWAQAEDLPYYLPKVEPQA